ncbi:MAG: TylF/MycF/NovP-related O-methyltransferase [Acetobacteraceae bacterium]
MPIIERLFRFARKPLPDKRAAITATLRGLFHADPGRLHGLLTGAHAPPRVLQADEMMYLAYRPDSDVFFKRHSELAQLSDKWIRDNIINNAGDLPRLYALVLNIKHVLDDNVMGDLAELGVYRGNSAALLAHYARIYSRKVFLFDTFEGFDRRDIIGVDRSKPAAFADTSLDQVRELVGDDDVTFVQGWFPQSIPPDLYASRFCLVHIDCDLYAPAKAALEFFYPRLSPGGLLIVHDYASPAWRGIKRAVDEYCRAIPERPIIFGDKSGTAMIRKSAMNVIS